MAKSKYLEVKKKLKIIFHNMQLKHSGNLPSFRQLKSFGFLKHVHSFFSIYFICDKLLLLLAFVSFISFIMRLSCFLLHSIEYSVSISFVHYTLYDYMGVTVYKMSNYCNCNNDDSGNVKYLFIFYTVNCFN